MPKTAARQKITALYEAFPSVKEGTPMYIAPEDRILIW